jgi:hypothetical protein
MTRRPQRGRPAPPGGQPGAQPLARSYTRALKNARFLQQLAPNLFDQDPMAGGFGTGVPLEILRNLHRIRHHSPLLRRHPAIVEFVRDNPLPTPGRNARDALFSGTIHFVQMTFQTSGGDITYPTADMNMIVQYAQHALVPIVEYAAQYGPANVTVSSTLLTHTINVPSASYSKVDLRGFVNDIVAANSLSADSCVFIISPQGLSTPEVGANSGYHDLADRPFIVAGVFTQGLTLDDTSDVYAMVISHEMAEMIVDPLVDGQNPEVCDPCDINCGNLTRVYFDNFDNFLGINQNSPPSGFSFTYYICAIAKPAGAADCPASAANCQYAPVTQDTQFVILKSTYTKDDVGNGATFAPAFWMQMSGFTNQELGLTSAAALNNPPTPAPSISVSVDPALNPPLTAAQIAAIAGNLPSVNTIGPLPIVPTDPSLQQDPQVFLYPYTVAFAGNGAFTTLAPGDAAFLTLRSTFTIGQITRTDQAVIELTAGQNPSFKDIDPANPAQFPSWLSFDLRFFKVAVASGGSASRFNATITGAGDAAAFIAAAIGNLNQNNAGGDTFDALPQDEDSSALEFQQQDNNGNFVFNFALARVRLLGNAPATAQNVRVFFRLFQAQSTSSSFDEATTYRFASDGNPFGHKIPLLGVQNDQNGVPEYVTIPCFASPRVNLSGPADMASQTDPPNAFNIDTNPGVEVIRYFGCWLDTNQPQLLFPRTPPAGDLDGALGWQGATLQSMRDAMTLFPHQCLIAEIRFDDTPIPPGADSGTSDKLAQRNIAWIDGPNPGQADSRRMPHPVQVLPTPVGSVNLDELLIFWGATPSGSEAQLFLPSMNASQIIQLATERYPAHRLRLVDANTIAVPAGGGATLVPLPEGTGLAAGLLSVNLPPGITRGDNYTITVRQLTDAIATPPPVINLHRQAIVTVPPGSLVWRRVAGAFQFSINISNKELLLSEERLLAVLRAMQAQTPTQKRWFPVLQRYIAAVGGRVQGFGGNPGKIPPSPSGDVPGKFPPPQHQPEPGHDHLIRLSGKIEGLVYDHFGDFEGFILETVHDGRTHRYESREGPMFDVANRAWRRRIRVSVTSERHRPHVPLSVVLHAGAWLDGDEG